VNYNVLLLLTFLCFSFYANSNVELNLVTTEVYAGKIKNKKIRLITSFGKINHLDRFLINKNVNLIVNKDEDDQLHVYIEISKSLSGEKYILTNPELITSLNQDSFVKTIDDKGNLVKVGFRASKIY